MNSKTLFGALVLSVALVSQGFSGELLDRLLGLNSGSGCNCGQPSACETVKACPACAAAAPAPKACAPAACESCGCDSCKRVDLFAGLKGLFACKSCGSESACGCEAPKCCAPEPKCCACAAPKACACVAPAPKACAPAACACAAPAPKACACVAPAPKCCACAAPAPKCCACAAPKACAPAACSCAAPKACAPAACGCDSGCSCGCARGSNFHPVRSLVQFVNGLFVCEKCSSCGCDSGCGCGLPKAGHTTCTIISDRAAGAPASVPAPAVKEAPLPKAPKADPSASLDEPRSIYQASRSVVQD